MKKRFKTIVVRLLPFLDFAALPLVYIAATVLKLVRRIGLKRLPFSKSVLLKVGVLPVRDQYYEPFFDAAKLTQPLDKDRILPGINWNETGQVALLRQFSYNNELLEIPVRYVDDLTFYFENNFFASGDAEFWYNLIRFKKPARIIEIGSGNSTKIARLAIRKNEEETPGYTCEHICIEPYEMPWLEHLGITVMRQKAEEIPLSFYQRLGEGDILFIDSSHIIRPQGDVLFEYLELIPSLRKGVLVHVHDIFSPKNYPKEWLIDHMSLWNEQYLLEAFLTNNPDWQIVGALNFLKHHHYDDLSAVCPRLIPEREPGSFYIVKTRETGASEKSRNRVAYHYEAQDHFDGDTGEEAGQRAYSSLRSGA